MLPLQATTTPLSTQTVITTASSVTSPSSSNKPLSTPASPVTTPTTGVSSPSTPAANPSNPNKPASPPVSSPTIGVTTPAPATNPSTPDKPVTNPVSSPSTGVTTQTPTGNPSDPSPSGAAVGSRSPSISSPSTGTTTTPLQAPSQAAPTGVTTTASSVTSPNSVPNAPSVTASNVTSPSSSSVPSPSTASSVSSPSSSVPSSSVSSVTPPVSSKPVSSVDDHVRVSPFDVFDEFYRAWLKLMAAHAQNLDDEQTRKEFEQAEITGDPNLLVSASLGVTIRAAASVTRGLGGTDFDNLQSIDDAVNQMPAEQQVYFRNQMLFEMYKCNGNVDCVKGLLNNLAASTSSATENGKRPTASQAWGSTPKHYMNPTQAYTGLTYGIGSGLHWIKKHYGNKNPLSKVYGRSMQCGRGAQAQMARVQANWQKFGDYFGPGKIFPTDMNGVVVDTSGNGSIDLLSLNSMSDFNAVGLLPGVSVGAPDGFLLPPLTPTQATPSSPIRNGAVIPIVVGQGIPPVVTLGAIQISVTVRGMSANGMTYVANPGHVLQTQELNQWNSQIGFVSYNLGSGAIGTFVIAQGSWSSGIQGTLGGTFGGNSEDATWDSLLDDIATDCAK